MESDGETNNGKIEVTWNSYDQSNPDLAPFTGVTYEVIVKDASDAVVKQETGITGTSQIIEGLDDRAAYKVTVIGHLGSVTSPVSATANVTTKKVEKTGPAFFMGANSATDLLNANLSLKGNPIKLTYKDNINGAHTLEVDTSGATTREDVFNAINAAIEADADFGNMVEVSYTANDFVIPWNPTATKIDFVLFFKTIAEKGTDVQIALIAQNGSDIARFNGSGTEN